MMMNRSLAVGAGVAAWLASVGCSSTKSSELETNAIRAEMRVMIYDNDIPAAGSSSTPLTGHGSHFTARLTKEDNLLEAVSLAGGDSLAVSTDKNVSIPMSNTAPGRYSSDYMDMSALKTATFAFTRASKTSALNSKVTVPEAMVLTAPLQDAKVSLTGGKVTVTWSNPVQGGKVRVFAQICKVSKTEASTSDLRVDDTGSYDLTIEELGGMPASDTCYLLQVIRVAEGTVDPAWHSGSTLWVERSVWVTITGTP